MKILNIKNRGALRVVLLAALVGTISACGGGGGGSNGVDAPDDGVNTPPPPSGNNIMRPTVIEYDYDNNGTTDATSTLSYDDNGRVTREEYVNNGDGMPDAFDLYDGAPQFTYDFAYDNEGRLLSNKRTSSVSTVEFVHNYDANGNVIRIDVSNTSSILGINRTYMVYSYNGNQAQQFDIYLTRDDTLLLTESFAYDMQGRVVQDMGISPVGGMGYERRYTWDAQGRLDFHEHDGNGDGIYEITYDYIFNDTSGKLEQRTNTHSSRPDPADFDNFTEFFSYDANGQIETIEYDNNNDGSMDAVARVTQRESGLCTAVYFPLLSKQAGHDGIPGSHMGDIGWCE